MSELSDEVAAWQVIRGATTAQDPGTVADSRTSQQIWNGAPDKTGIRRTSRVYRKNVRGEWVIPLARARGDLLWVHGAAPNGSVESYRPWMWSVCRATPMNVFTLDFRRPPEYRHPYAYYDVLAALRFLETSRHPMSRLIVGGDSFGAAPLLAAILMRRDAGLALPKGMWFVSPKVDFSTTPHYQPPGRSANQVAAGDAFRGYYYDEGLGTWVEDDQTASPGLANLSGLPPILIQESTPLYDANDKYIGGDNPGIYAGAVEFRDKARADAGSDGACDWSERSDGVPHIWPFYGPNYGRALGYEPVTPFVGTAETLAEAAAWMRAKLAG